MRMGVVHPTQSASAQQFAQLDWPKVQFRICFRRTSESDIPSNRLVSLLVTLRSKPCSFYRLCLDLQKIRFVAEFHQPL
jgi:hypothetical protein